MILTFNLLFYWSVTILAIIGVVLNIKRNVYCFYIWLLTNGAFAVETALYGAWNMTFLFLIYFILAVMGILEWKRNDVEAVDGKD